MKILILSDNHSRGIDIDLSQFDYVIHCGDCGNFDEYARNLDNVLIVRGNCDFSGEKEIL